MPALLILVKHALPILQPDVPPREWRLGEDGEQQATALARRLASYLPFTLVSSSEPKAVRTAEIVAAELGLATRVVDDLHEFDRPALPLLTRDDHERLSAQIFANPSQVMIGRESGATALERFQAALHRSLELADRETLVAIAHGTVISLLVAAHNPSADAFELWKRLECGSFVVLRTPGFALQESV